MPTNSDRYAMGNRYHHPKPTRRQLGRQFAAVIGTAVMLLTLLALFCL